MFIFDFIYKKNDDENENKNDNGIVECTICMENKKLYNFCNNHKYCNKCISEWIKKDNFCPECRQLCINKSYFKHNVEIINYNYNTSNIHNFNICFKNWHRYLCIYYKHNFLLDFSSNNRMIRLYCKECNVEQLFKIADLNI